MKLITNNFKEQIAKLGREIDFKIFLHTNDKIITEDGNLLVTESNANLLVEQLDEEEIDETITKSDIYNVGIINKGNILSTMMKEFDFEIKQDLRIGDVVNCQFGLKVGQEYEYIDYGKYIIYSKEFNEDTKSYSYVAFDRMLLTMQEVDQEFLTNLEEKTLLECIDLICNKVGLINGVTQEEAVEYPNLNNEINKGTFTDLQITYRDVLDMISQALGLSMITDDKYLVLKPFNRDVVDTVDEHFLKDTNVKFGEKYMINSVVLSRSEDSDNIYRRDEESIAKHGVHEFKIKDNLIMLYDDREDYIDEIFEQLNGIEYYINDFDSLGITYLDWLDFYNVKIGDNYYKCLMLNDEIKIQQGLQEKVYTDEPEETVTDYKTSGKSDKEVSFIVDKQNAKINGTIRQDEIIASLNVAIEDGQGIIDLKGNSVTIESDNFELDADGRIDATAGEIGGFEITDTNFETEISGLFNYDYYDLIKIGSHFLDRLNLDSNLINIYDVSGDNQIGSIDFSRIKYMIDNGTETYDWRKIINGSFVINANDPERCVVIKDGNGSLVTSLGVGGIESNTIACKSLVCSEEVNAINDFNGIVLNGESGVIYCASLVQTSRAEKKKNFEKLENGLEIVKNIDIYKFNLKEEKDTDKKHIGFVIGDGFNYEKDITSAHDGGVDIYSFVSVCCKAIQEQQEQIETLKKELNELKEMIKNGKY